MKKILLATMIAATVSISAFAGDDYLEANKAFTGAEAHQDVYKAIYQLDTNNADIVKKAFGNIHHLLDDPRIKGKVQVELVPFSGGTDVMMKGSPYETELKNLISKGVIVAQCLNSLKVRKLEKSQLYDFIAYVPSGNAELLIRATEGWVIIKP